MNIDALKDLLLGAVTAVLVIGFVWVAVDDYRFTFHREAK